MNQIFFDYFSNLKIFYILIKTLEDNVLMINQNQFFSNNIEGIKSPNY